MQMACFYHTFEHLGSTDLWSEQGSPFLLSGEAQAVPGDDRHRGGWVAGSTSVPPFQPCTLARIKAAERARGGHSRNRASLLGQFPFASIISQREAGSALDCGDYANETVD